MPSSSYTGSGETSGTKQIQEDGKRLLHAGGKLGKKGGLAAKGLLAKAKDKARAVSSSDKVDHWFLFLAQIWDFHIHFAVFET
jgi:hypothetical protein